MDGSWFWNLFNTISVSLLIAKSELTSRDVRQYVCIWLSLCHYRTPAPTCNLDRYAQNNHVNDTLNNALTHDLGISWYHYHNANRLWMAIVHYSDAIMGAIASQITSLTIVYSTVYSDADQRKHQSSASLAFVRGIHRGPVNSQHKWPVTRKMFPFDNVIMPNCKPSRYPTCKLVCPQSKTAKLKIRPIVSYHAFQFF